MLLPVVFAVYFTIHPYFRDRDLKAEAARCCRVFEAAGEFYNLVGESMGFVTY